MFGKILCWFGVHHWEGQMIENEDLLIVRLTCSRCGETVEEIARPSGYEPIDDMGVEAHDERL